MKKIFGLLLIALAIVACNKEPKDAVILSGKVENAKGMKALKIIGDNDFSHEIALNEDGSFIDTIQPVKDGYYSISMGRSGFPIYLIAGDNMKLNLDLANRETPVSFVSGESLAINNFNVKKNKVTKEKVAEFGGSRALFLLGEEEFLAKMKEVEEAKLKVLEEAKDLPKEFVATERKTMEYDHLYSLSTYEKYHGYFAKDEEYKPSEKITKPLSEITYNNAEDYEKIAPYRRIVMGHFQEKMYDENADENAIIEEVKATGVEPLKKDFAKFLVSALSLGEKDMDAKVAQVKSLTSDKKVMEDLDAFLKDAETLGQGKPSPKFAYKNIKGKEVKLDDLKGKLVYVDVWATWCGPCKGELPHLQKLEKAYHRKAIHFVSVSVDDNMDAWEKMVKDKKLGGIQVHADKAWKSDFVQAYKINGIPRFILLDKEGNIISADAPRPSSDKIKPLIDEWLKK